VAQRVEYLFSKCKTLEFKPEFCNVTIYPQYNNNTIIKKRKISAMKQFNILAVTVWITGNLMHHSLQ
jgi:hypothetical protein